MKKMVVVLITIMCILIVFMPFSTSIKVYASTSAKEIVTIDDLETFMSRAGNNRSACSRNEKTASAYLAEVMQTQNLSFYGTLTSYTKEFNTKSGKSQNVIGVKKSNTENAPKVILGAHYDNAYNLNGEQTSSFGVFDNASGVVCLIGLIKVLATYELPFDVVYIFYGAEEIGYKGSSNFVNSLSYIDKTNILLAFNYDSIGAGDYTYYFTGDSANNYKKIFNANTYNIKEMPIFKRLNLLSKDLAYSHIGLKSDNVTYLKNGVKCVTFFSGNLSHSGTGYIESTKNEDVIHTQNDNLNFVLANYPNFVENINRVANLTLDVVTAQDFTQTMQGYSNEINLFFFNNKFVIGGIFIIGFMILVSLKVKENKTNEF